MLGKHKTTPTTSSSKNKSSTSGTSSSLIQKQNSIQDSFPTIPIIKIQDNAKLLPKYTIALEKSANDSVAPDDLHAIQLELEQLLCTATLRYHVLKSEYDAIDKGIADDRRDRDKKIKQSFDRQVSSPGKKKMRYDEKLPKSKDNKYSRSSSSVKSTSKRRTMSNIVPSPAPSQQTDDSMDGMSSHGQQKDNIKTSIPKNDAPSRFWLSVEPYCMPITQEDVKLIDDLIEEYSNSTLSPIPELGPHYSTKWAAEDLKEEQDHSNPNMKNKRRFETSPAGDEVIGMVKNAEKIMGENIAGPLTQRLVCALLEENVLPENEKNYENTENQNNNHRLLSLMKNGIEIERRVQKELIEHGLLDPDDLTPGQDDEILAEIKRVRTELSAISEYNCGELKRLQSAAKEEIKRLEIKRKLDAVDQEIIETYKRITSTKRRPLSKQEREEVFRLTEEQKRLTELLDSMPLPGNFKLEDN